MFEWVARCDPKPLIVVDSVIAFHPGAENDANETRQYMSQYRRLTAMGATPVLLHHVGKSETAKDYRGSSEVDGPIPCRSIHEQSSISRRLIPSGHDHSGYGTLFAVELDIAIMVTDGQP